MRTLLAALALVAGSAAAGPILDEASVALRTDRVYIHPDADLEVSDADANRLRDAIRDGDEPIFIAVLPQAAEAEVGGIDELPRALRDATGLGGTYAVATGRGVRAGSDFVQAGRIMTNAFDDNRSDGAGAVLLAFVEDVQAAGAASRAGSDSSAEGSNGGSRVLPWLLIGGAVGGGVYLMRRTSKRRRLEHTALLGDQDDLRAELSVLADDVMRLEPEVELKPEARDDYEAGVARFKWAQAAVDSIDSPDDVPRVRRGMAEAHYAMARARATIRGHEPPAPPAELQQPGRYGEPAIELDDRRQPVYAGYDGGGWGGGGYFGGNGLFAGLLLGHMLSGGNESDGAGWASGGPDGGTSDWGGSAGGGDWGGGGGDWGGDGGGGGDW